MDEQRQEKIYEAAEQFANVIKESYRAVAERGVSAQELNAELMEHFFNNVIDNLRTQAEGTRQMTQQLAAQQERQREATQALTQESLAAYMDFVNSMFSYWKTGTRATERATTQTHRTTTSETPPAPEQRAAADAQRSATTETPPSPERQAGAQLPFEDYDSLNVQQISQRLDELSDEEIRQLREYEAQNKSRRTLLQRLDERIEGGSA